MDEELLTPPEAAKKLRRSPGFLAKLRMTGDGPKYVKLAGRVFYREHDLYEWIRRSVRRSTAEQSTAA